MASRMRGGLLAAVGVCLVALCSHRPAQSQPGELVISPSRTEVCNKPCQDKMRRLEHQVKSLQREVVQLRAEVDRLRDVDLPAPPIAEAELPPSCDVPWTVDTRGIKRIRPECLDQAALAQKAECLRDPYIRRADGVTTIKPECMD